VYGAETVLNRVSVQISGGTASSVASGTASQTEYGIKNFSLTDIPLVNDAAGSALASALLNTYQNPEVRFDEATILVNPLSDAQIETMASLEIGDVLTVTKNFTTGSPASITKNVVVEGIQHVVTPSRHDVRLRLGQIDVLTPFILSGYTPIPSTRTNLVENPNFETNTTGWAAASSTVSRITTASFIGSACMQMTSTSASDTTARTAYDPNTTMAAGQSLTASVYLYNYAGNNRQHRVDIRCFTSGGGVAGIITGTATTINVGAGWTRLSVTGTTPANTASLDVAIFCQVNNPSLSNVTYIDAVMLETGSTLLPYFDGSFADTYVGYTLTSQSWSGTANGSTSTTTWDASTVTRTNLAQNPNYETNTSFWSADSGNTISRITTDSYLGTASLKCEVTSATGALSIFQPSGSRVPMTAGVTNTMSVYVKVPTGKPSVTVTPVIRYHTAVTGGSFISDTTGTAVVVTSAMGWTRISVTGTSPVNTGAINMRTSTGTMALGDVLLYDAWLLEAGSTLLPYFDGTYADTYSGYTLTSQAWTGTADASTSTATWGLTSSYVAGSELDDPTIGLY
jgi:hypothetical protein